MKKKIVLFITTLTTLTTLFAQVELYDALVSDSLIQIKHSISDFMLPDTEGNIWDEHGSLIHYIKDSEYISVCNELVHDPNDRVKVYLAYLKKWHGKRFVVRSCIKEEEYYHASYGEIQWNKHCYQPLSVNYVMTGEHIKVVYETVPIDSMDNYRPVYNHHLKGYLLGKEWNEKELKP